MNDGSSLPFRACDRNDYSFRDYETGKGKKQVPVRISLKLFFYLKERSSGSAPLKAVIYAWFFMSSFFITVYQSIFRVTYIKRPRITNSPMLPRRSA